MAISEFTKRELVRLCGVAPGLVSVAPLAPDPSFSREPDAERLSAVRKRYGVPGRFVVLGGGSDPRKNVEGALRAYARLPEPLRRETPALVTGQRWHGRDVPVADEVRSGLGRPDDDLRALLTLADAFAFLPLYEGFGLPPLEALACGAPVICSATTSLPEVVGDAGLLSIPATPRGWPRRSRRYSRTDRGGVSSHHVASRAPQSSPGTAQRACSWMHSGGPARRVTAAALSARTTADAKSPRGGCQRVPSRSTARATRRPSHSHRSRRVDPHALGELAHRARAAGRDGDPGRGGLERGEPVALLERRHHERAARRKRAHELVLLGHAARTCTLRRPRRATHARRGSTSPGQPPSSTSRPPGPANAVRANASQSRGRFLCRSKRPT